MKSSSVSKGGVMINPIRKKTKIHAERMGLVDMANKVDELVKEHNNVLDLLQAKEEASNYKIVSFDPVGETVPEASKGECKEYRLSDCIACGKQYLVPKNVMAGAFCDECRKNNPPEHEETIGEWVADFEKNFGALFENNEVYANVKVKDYIHNNFISKEKIKNHCKSTLKNYEIRSNFSDGVIYAINNLISSLGLGD